LIILDCKNSLMVLLTLYHSLFKASDNYLIDLFAIIDIDFLGLMSFIGSKIAISEAIFK